MSSGLGGASKSPCTSGSERSRTHTQTKEAQSHRKPHPREIFCSMFPFQIFQPGFPSSCFIPLPVGPKKKEDTIFYITLSHVIMTHHNLPMTPHFHFAVQTHREKYQQPDSSGRLNRKNARSKEKTKNKIQVVTSLTEGAA